MSEIRRAPRCQNRTMNCKLCNGRTNIKKIITRGWRHTWWTPSSLYIKGINLSWTHNQKWKQKVNTRHNQTYTHTHTPQIHPRNLDAQSLPGNLSKSSSCLIVFLATERPTTNNNSLVQIAKIWICKDSVQQKANDHSFTINPDHKTTYLLMAVLSAPNVLTSDEITSRWQLQPYECGFVIKTQKWTNALTLPLKIALIWVLRVLSFVNTLVWASSKFWETIKGNLDKIRVLVSSCKSNSAVLQIACFIFITKSTLDITITNWSWSLLDKKHTTKTLRACTAQPFWSDLPFC